MSELTEPELILPSTLLIAEENILESIKDYIESDLIFKLSITLRFENLRLNPIAYRLNQNLTRINKNSILLWADAGGSALAKRDMPDLTDKIYSYNDFLSSIKTIDTSNTLIAVSPQPFDFDEFKSICDQYEGKIIMLNGKLEDMAVGIGTVGRERRKEFIYSWKTVYYLQPLSRGALLKESNSRWNLFKKIDSGYVFCESFENKPDEETILLSLTKLSEN